MSGISFAPIRAHRCTVSRDGWAEGSSHPSLLRHAGLPLPRFDHLRTLTDPTGLWEHAEFSTPREEHGYCTEDNARALIVVSRQPGSAGDLTDLAAIYLEFVLEARTATGAFRNRRSADGVWSDDGWSDDSQGRAWWGLGVASHSAPAGWMRRASAGAFATCPAFASPHLRANAYAALGAVEMLTGDPSHGGARDLLERTSAVIAESARSAIPWPETRLTYDNARLPEALLAAGTTLGDRSLVATGVRLLEWLVAVETNDNHDFSFAASDGWSVGEPRPGFDQQPIEAWAMTDACHRAWTVTGDEVWRQRARQATRWLLGSNDTGMVLYDRDTGATHDGLQDGSVNQNQGAESTIAGIAALQVTATCDARPDDLLSRR